MAGDKRQQEEQWDQLSGKGALHGPTMRTGAPIRKAVLDAGGPADFALPYWNYDRPFPGNTLKDILRQIVHEPPAPLSAPIATP